MPDSQSLKIPKNLALWLTIAGILIGSIVDSAMTRDQVDRNRKSLEKYPPAVFANEQADMAEDIDEIKGDLKELVRAFNEYTVTHE